MPNFLHDAIVFHKTLNPAIWVDGEMKPEIKQALMNMASEFQDFLGLDELDVLDITVSGSNAAYTYTPHSDIDLHLVVKIPAKFNQLYTELFDAKKNLYNLTHNQTIKGFDVEFYVQDSKIGVESIGIYSVLRDKWISYPKRVKAQIDDLSILSKVDAYTVRINSVIQSNNYDAAKRTWDDLKNMRKAGLAEGGEFSPENLAYKILRTRGLLQALFDHIIAIKDAQLSVESQDMAKPQLVELFDADRSVKVVTSTSDTFETTAIINGRTITFGADRLADLDNKTIWEVAFSENRQASLTAPTVSHFGVTGSGGEVEVFSMIAASMKLFVEKYSPDVVKFTADKTGNSDSRARLYKRMVDRLSPAGYVASTNSTTSRTNFWIEKK
jgi:hypothetical protein